MSRVAEKTIVAALLLLTAPVALGQDTSASSHPTARSGNLLFNMPKDWTRKERSGVTLLMPPQLPEGKWFELRIVPGEESVASPAQAVENQADLIRQRYTVLQATPIGNSRHKKGWLAASMAMTVNVASAEKPDLRFWVIYAARPTSRIEVLHYVSNDYEVYVNKLPVVEKFIDEMNFANLIILADGAPKLTELFVYETSDFLEWLLDVPFTDDQRQAIRAAMLDDWKRKDQKAIDSTMELIKMRRQLAMVDPAAAEIARAKVQGEFVAALRKDTAAIPVMLAKAYDAGHKPIADGQPPLTRQAADAMLELIYYMAGVLENAQPLVPNTQEKDQWAARLAEQYPKMSQQQRASIAQMPTVWAAMRWVWPTLPADQKDKLKEQFAKFEPIRQLRQSLAAAKKAKDESLAAAVARMQRSHESFMMLSNISHTMHNANMAMISNIGGTGWKYEYRR